ncbi:hypothetical protein [Mesobacterium pallidum]|uniref:hypothetical protein n=1 Tax=Mesobacterium pallidum TaxID=2872037 RepID=UPI001EE1F3DB|nr:hypothetical protein [Mesobacterium pallidum]
MLHLLKRHRDEEDGAVTVDWVVITAAVVGLSAIGFAGLESSAQDLIDSAAVAVDGQDDFD